MDAWTSASWCDLASVFRMRIELRQIGVRDEAKLFGGLKSATSAVLATS